MDKTLNRRRICYISANRAYLKTLHSRPVIFVPAMLFGPSFSSPAFFSGALAGTIFVVHSVDV